MLAEDIILYIENLENSIKKTVRTNEFSNVVEYKINIQKSVLFLYTTNKLPEKEIKNTIPFTNASKRIKYLGINLTKEAEDLYTENDRALKKEIEDINKWKDTLCSCIGKINIV